MHGYQLSRESSESLGGFWRVSYGSLYPTLRRLERSGEVEAVASAETRRPSQAGLPHHRDGRAGVPGAPAGDAARQPVRGPAVPRAPGVLPVPAARDAPAPAGAPACLPRGPAQHHPDSLRDHARARRRLHAGAHGARALRHRVRHRVGGRPHHRRAPNTERTTGGSKRGPTARSAERSTPHEQGSSRDRGRGQLRLITHPRSRVLQGRRSADRVPGLMHVDLGGYHIRDIEFVAAFDVDAEEGGQGRGGGHLRPSRTTPIRFADVPTTGVIVQRGRTLDGLGTYYREIDHGVRLAPSPTSRRSCGTRRPTSSCATSRWDPSRPRAYYAQCAIDAKVAFVNCLPVFIAVGGRVGQEVRRRRRADHRRRHQEPGGRHDHAPRPDEALRGPRREDQPHLPAELRRQHGLHEHAGARAPGVEEGLEDAVGAVPDGDPAGQGRRSTSGRRDHVPWLEDRKWAQIRIEGTSFGDVPLNVEMKLEVWDSPELGGHRHRRHPLREAGARPRDRRPVDRARAPTS